MKDLALRIWMEDEGVLSFEWILLTTLLVIGIVGGVAAVRDAIIDEMGDVAEAMLALDQSYTINFPLAVEVHTPGELSGDASDSSFTDFFYYLDCARGTLIGQDPQDDAADGG